MDGSVNPSNLKSSFKLLGLTFSSKLDWGSYIVSIAKTASKKIGAWFVLWSFSLLRLFCISKNLSYSNVWNSVVMSGLVLLVATWNCWISYRNGYAGLFFLHLLPWILGSSSKWSQLKSFLEILFCQMFIWTGSTGSTFLFSREVYSLFWWITHFSVTIPRCYKDIYVNSFFPGIARLWNFLPLECFPLT